LENIWQARSGQAAGLPPSTQASPALEAGRILDFVRKCGLLIDLEDWSVREGGGGACITLTLSALARASYRHDDLLSHLCRALVLQLKHQGGREGGEGTGGGGGGVLSAREVAQAMHALAVLNYRDASALAALARAVPADAEFCLQSLANIAWASAALEIREANLTKAIVGALDTHFALFLQGRLRRVQSMVLRRPDSSAPFSRISALPPPLPGDAGMKNARMGPEYGAAQLSDVLQEQSGRGVEGGREGGGEEEDKEEEEEINSTGTFVEMQEMRQVHQFLVECRLRGVDVSALCVGGSGTREAWCKRERMCRAVFEARSRNRAMPSQLQAQVEEALRRLAGKTHCVFKEPIDAAAGYALDLIFAPLDLVPFPHAHAGAAHPALAGGGGAFECGVGEGQLVGEELRERGVVIEVDGPAHFLRPGGRLPSGSTLMKRRHLEKLGYKLISVPFFEWNALDDAQEQAQVLKKYSL
jgi:hypothetical protein